MWTGVVCGLLAGAMWGMVFIVPELLSAFTPLEMAVGRYVAYGAIAFILMLPRLRNLVGRLERDDYFALVRHALAGNLVYYMFLALGRNDHGAVPLRQLAMPLLVTAAGIACINIDVFQHAAAAGASMLNTVIGVACATGALLCWSWYTLDNARYLKRNPHYSSAEWSALYGLSTGLIALVIGGIAFAIFHGDVTGAAGAASGRDWTLFWICNSLLALGASVIGNHLWNVASRRVPVTLSGQLILFETLFALMYGFIYKQQFPRPLEIAAIALLIAGVTWSMHVHAQEEELSPA
jgi:drug/metabolite transporter (DMT)-like permease